MPFTDSLRALSSEFPYPVPSPAEKPLACLVTALLLLVAYFAFGESSKGKGNFPIANPKRPFEFTYSKRVAEFIGSPRQHFAKYREQYPDTPYWLNLEYGKTLTLPSSMINEIRVNPSLSSLAAIKEIQFGTLKGFETIGDGLDEDLVKLIKEQLNTKNLSKLTHSVSSEASEALQDVFPDSQEWSGVVIAEPIFTLVARASSRVFGGKILCRSTAWRNAMADYTSDFIRAGIVLRFFPKWSRSLAQWVLPPCASLRKDLEVCRQTLEPILRQRQEQWETAAQSGAQEEYSFDRAFDNLERKVDRAVTHISLANVAIHSTTDLLSKTLLALAEHPELFEPLKEEVVREIGTTGLNIAGLARLELMDSVLKEVQRLNPPSNNFMNRIALDDLRLSNGMVVPKGTMVTVGITHMLDNTFYENGGVFDGYRFLRMREDPTKRHQSYLVSTSPEHLGFGHGSHTCPGRFFGANEVKIMLSHLLLKFEWKFPEGETPKIMNFGLMNMVHPEAKLLFRRRSEELDLDSLVG